MSGALPRDVRESQADHIRRRRRYFLSNSALRLLPPSHRFTSTRSAIHSRHERCSGSAQARCRCAEIRLVPQESLVKRTLARVVKVVLVILIAAGASARLLQAQLPQGVGTWLPRGAVADARIGAAAVTLDDGRTLVAGGRLADGSVTDGVAVYDPVANATTTAGQLFAPRVNASATLLADGRVLITGGLVGGAPSADVESSISPPEPPRLPPRWPSPVPGTPRRDSSTTRC